MIIRFYYITERQYTVNNFAIIQVKESYSNNSKTTTNNIQNKMQFHP